MQQYPHYIHKVAKCDAYKDDYGRWIQDGTEKIEYVGRCRYEADGRGSTMFLDDGTHVVMSGIVYMPVTDVYKIVGSEIVVSRDKDGKDVLCTKIVYSGSAGRLNTRLYV